MKTYTLFWLTGNSELVHGTDVADGMNKAGYSAGSLRALDFYGEGDLQNQWTWDKENRTWNKIKKIMKGFIVYPTTRLDISAIIITEEDWPTKEQIIKSIESPTIKKVILGDFSSFGSCYEYTFINENGDGDFNFVKLEKISKLIK